MPKIYIKNEIGHLSGYAILPGPDLIEIETEIYPDDFENWVWNGKELKREHIPANAADVDEDISILKEQNSLLMKQLSQSIKEQSNLKMMVAQLTKKVTQLNQEEGGSHE
ncbi:hypothetical protein GVK83_13085 [Enterococcus hirae]|uniref:hypothetical protein n=1 Tax=Enterococcus hirae TaxID=1354 RepID=UPI001373289D|nr:hypothetical protein [Enterococcus hirae]NBA28522.1 hypothetical protein [Enterococcus hirae]NBA37704.1 hypothetical protein [Enterococcus hirae]